MHRTGGKTLGGHKQNLVHKVPGEKNSGDPTGDLPVGVRESPEEAWAVVACCRTGDTACSSTCMGSFEGGHHYLHYLHHSFSSVQFSSVTQSCPTLRDPMDCSMLGLPVHQHPLLLLPSVFPSITVFSNESALHVRWPKYWSFSFNISPSNEHLGLISFRMDWLDFLAVQGTLKSLLLLEI